jgi:sugar diacid utilization regulator
LVVAAIERLEQDEVVEAVLVAIRGRIPAFAVLVADGLGEPLRETIRLGCEIEFAILAEGRAVTEGERFALEQSCRDLLLWGPTPEDVLTAFDVAGPQIWERLVRATRPEELQALLGAAGRLFSMTEAVQAIHAALRGDDLDGMPEDETLARHLVRSVAADLSDGDAREAGRRLRLDPTTLVRPFVLVQDPTDSLTRGHLARSLRADGVLAVTLADRIVGLAPAGPWAASLPDDATTVVAEPGPERPGGPLWDELHDAAVVARARGARGTTDLHDMTVECMLLAAPSARRRLQRMAQELRDPAGLGRAGKVDLLETARAALTGGLVRSRIAAHLDVHPSTVRYRTERLEEALGLELRKPWHRGVLALALLADVLPADPDELVPAAPRAVPRTEAVLAGVAARVDQDVVAERIASEVQEALPDFVDDEVDREILRAEARAYVAEALFAFHDVLPGDLGPHGSAGSMVEGRLRRGVSATDALRALSLSGRILWEALLEEATEDEASRLPAVAVRLMRLANPAALVTGIPATHISSPTTAAASEFLVDLLSAGTTAPDHVHALARTWGVDPMRSWRPVVAVPAPSESARRLGTTMRAMGWLAAVRREQVVALVPAEVAVERLPTSPTLVAIGSHGPLAGLSSSVADVLRLADVASRRGARGIVTHAEWELDLLVAANPVTSERLRRRVLEQLGGTEPGARSDLVTTMVRHLENDLDRARTARAMHLHPNSLDHRLRSITARTGLSFASTEDVLTMTLVATAHAARRP